MKSVLFCSLMFFWASFSFGSDKLVFESQEGPGKDKHVVILTGDEEYRSEESGPMLAKILNKRHGFKTSVLFAINPETGYIDPNYQKNIPGMEALETADVVILGLRFRDLPDNQLKYFADYLNAGKPVIGFRTSTHAFRTKNKLGEIHWNNFGPSILGEGWAGHYGKHKVEGARSQVLPKNAEHAILNGVGEIFAASDVYGVRRVTQENATILLNAVVTETLDPTSKAVVGKVPQASAWLKNYKTPKGKEGMAFCTTMGSSDDFADEDLRRLVINAAFYLSGIEVPEKANVDYVDPFKPSFYSFRKKDYFSDLKMKPEHFSYGSNRVSGPTKEDDLEALKNRKKKK